MRAITAIILCGGILAACAGSHMSKLSPTEEVALQAVSAVLRDKLIEDPDDGGIGAFDLGTLNGGVALILTSVYTPATGESRDLDCAFWVVGEKVYAVNDNAKELAPELEQAPAEIHYAAVRQVAK